MSWWETSVVRSSCTRDAISIFCLPTQMKHIYHEIKYCMPSYVLSIQFEWFVTFTLCVKCRASVWRRSTSAKLMTPRVQRVSWIYAGVNIFFFQFMPHCCMKIIGWPDTTLCEAFTRFLNYCQRILQFENIFLGHDWRKGTNVSCEASCRMYGASGEGCPLLERNHSDFITAWRHLSGD